MPMSDRALQIIAETLQPTLAPGDAQAMAVRIIHRLDEAADAPALAVDDVVQVAHTAPACAGCLAHIQELRVDGTIRIRMPADNGNHGYAILRPEDLIATGGSITPEGRLP